MRARRTGKDELQGARAMAEILQRLRIGSGGIAMIAALHHRPGRLRGSADFERWT